MEITSVNLIHITVQTRSNYVMMDDQDNEYMVYVERIQQDGNTLTAECRLWKPHALYDCKGKEPHEKAVVLQKAIVAVPLEDFVDAADIVHASVFKKIPEVMRQNTFFFTHLEDEQHVPRVKGANRFQTLPNLATIKREVGMAIRSHVGRHLRRKGHSRQSLRISFSFQKEQVVEALGEHFQIRTKGKTRIFKLNGLEDLDGLCQPGWDYHRFADGFFNCVTGFNLRVCNTEFFTAVLRISNKRPFAGNYREISSPLFKS